MPWVMRRPAAAATATSSPSAAAPRARSAPASAASDSPSSPASASATLVQAPVLSNDANVRAIQHALFGYPLATGTPKLRRLRLQALHFKRQADYYPEEIWVARVRDKMHARQGPEAYGRRILQGFSLQGRPGVEEFGPFLPGTKESQRALLRQRALMLATTLKATALKRTRIESIYRDRYLVRRRFRGKAAPKKGGSKKAARKKKK